MAWNPSVCFWQLLGLLVPLSSDRIAAVTKELLVSAGIDMELFGAHTTRAVGLALLRALGLSASFPNAVRATPLGKVPLLEGFPRIAACIIRAGKLKVSV